MNACKFKKIHWGPAIRTTDTEVDSLIRTIKERMLNNVR